jgi:hypothetical protein
MGRNSETGQLTGGILGQHLSLAVAAHLARTQLVPDPLTVYDAQHLADMLDAVGNALARVAPLYVQEVAGGDPRPLLEGELQGARVRRGATLLALRDGRNLSAVSVRRADLRQAIAILKAVGIPELRLRAGREAPKAAAPANGERLLEELRELEAALPEDAARANRLLVSLARRAAAGQIANLAMQLMSALHDGRDPEPLLAALRAAVEQTAKS